MAKLILNDLTNLTNEATAVASLNSNNAAVKTALENTLSRDGTSPNSMSAPLDMNSQRILNLPSPSQSLDPVRLIDLSSYVTSGTVPSTYNPKTYGAVANGVHDDTVAIHACIAAAASANGTVVLDDGTYAHASTIFWARQKLKVIALGANVVFLHTGTGVAHDFNGLIYGDPSQGVMRGVFGGPNRIQLKGNPAGGTTKLVYVTNWHASEMNIKGRDAQYIFWCDNAFGAPTGSAAVSSTFDIQIGANHDRAPFVVVPFEGVHLDSCHACVFPNLISEESTNYGLRLLGNCGGNNFFGGVTESIVQTGVRIETGCSKNNFYGFDSEGNNTGGGTGKDWIIEGSNNAFYGCAGAGTTPGSIVSGNSNTFNNTKFQSLNIQAGANFNDFTNCAFITAFTDSGTATRLMNISGGLGIADKMPFRGTVSNILAQNNDTSFSVTNSSATTSARATLIAGNDLGGGVFGAAASTYTDRPILANRAFVESGAGLGGIALNTGNASPIVFGINNTDVGRITTTGGLLLNGLTASSALATDVNKVLVSVANTGTGSNVLATSPTLVTPALGTPTALVLTNATGLPAASLTGLSSGLPNFLAVASSANLATAMTDETGSGSLVFGTSPNLTTPNIVGVTSGSNATAGSIGEFISGAILAGAAVALTTGNPANIVTLSLTAGDWDVWGSTGTTTGGTTVITTVDTTVTTTSAAQSIISATNPGLSRWAGSVTGVNLFLPANPQRISLSVTTNVFLVVTGVFTTSTLSAYGFIGARRVR